MENIKNKIDVKLVNTKKDYLEWTSTPTMCHTKYLTMISHDALHLAIQNKVTLTLNKPVYIEMCILELKLH